MSNEGVMNEIKKLLEQGKSSRQLIDLGYKPGSVYTSMRQLKNKDNSLRKDKATCRTITQDAQPGTAVSEAGDDDYPIWHASPAIPCPGCGKPVVHWIVCPDCSRLFPSVCACPEDSPAVKHGYSLTELLKRTAS